MALINLTNLILSLVLGKIKLIKKKFAICLIELFLWNKLISLKKNKLLI